MKTKNLRVFVKALEVVLHKRVDVGLLIRLFNRNVEANPFALKTSPQVKYNVEQFTHAILFSGINRMSIELGATILKTLDPASPSPDAVYDQINKLAIPEVDEAVNNHLQKTVTKTIKGKTKKKQTIVLDLHKEPYYGKKESEYIIKSKPQKSTNPFYFYATACLPKTKPPKKKGGGEGKLLTLAVKTVKKGEKRAEIGIFLIKNAEKIVGDVGMVVADGEFYIAEFMRYLDQAGKGFAIRAHINGKLKEYVERERLAEKLPEDGKTGVFLDSYTCTNKRGGLRHEVKILFFKKDGEIIALAVNKNSRASAKRIIETFNPCFGVESTYRDGRDRMCRGKPQATQARSVRFYTGLILLNLKMIYALLKEEEGSGTLWDTRKDLLFFFLCLLLALISILGKPPSPKKIKKLFEQKTEELKNMILD